MHKQSLKEKDMEAFCVKHVDTALTRGVSTCIVNRNYTEILNLIIKMTNKTDLVVTSAGNKIIIASNKHTNQPTPSPKKSAAPVNAIFTPLRQSETQTSSRTR